MVVKREFTVAASPASRTIYRNGTGTYTVTVGSVNDFSSPVTLSVSGLPDGVTESFSPNPVTPGRTSELTLTAGSGAALGADEFTVTGTAAGMTKTDTAEVVVPSFMVTMTPETGDVNQGSSRTYTVTVTPKNGFSRNVSLSVSDLATGLTGRFSRNPVTSSNWTSTLTIDASCSAAATADEFTVTGSGGGYAASDTAEVTPRRFSVRVSPASANLQRDGSVEYEVEIDKQSGFTGNVRLSVPDLANDVTGRFSNDTTSTTSTLTLTAGSDAPLGEHDFTVTGTAHGCSRTVTAEVVITQRPAFEVSVTPERGDVERGSSRTYNVVVEPEPGFTSNVTLAVSGLGTGLTGSFSRSPVTPSNWTSTLTVDTGCEAALRSDTFTVTGTGGGESDPDTARAVPRGFSLSGPSETISLAAGSSGAVTVTVSPQTGFASNVSLSVSDLPEGVTGSFRPASTRSTSRLNLTVASTAPAASTRFTVTGTAHGCPESITVPIEITRPGFQVALTPESATLRQGTTADYTVTVTPETDFTSDVTLTVAGLPQGVTGEFTPNPVNASSTPAWTSTLRLTAASDAAAGPADFTVTGTSGDRSATDRAAVEVTVPPPICALTLDPGRAGVMAGGSQVYAIGFGLNTVFGTTADFALSVTGLPQGVTQASFPGSRSRRRTGRRI